MTLNFEHFGQKGFSVTCSINHGDMSFGTSYTPLRHESLIIVGKRQISSISIHHRSTTLTFSVLLVQQKVSWYSIICPGCFTRTDYNCIMSARDLIIQIYLMYKCLPVPENEKSKLNKLLRYLGFVSLSKFRTMIKCMCKYTSARSIYCINDKTINQGQRKYHSTKWIHGVVHSGNCPGIRLIWHTSRSDDQYKKATSWISGGRCCQHWLTNPHRD